jgi:tetratricopeptide (TPR) repeat protein
VNVSIAFFVATAFLTAAGSPPGVSPLWGELTPGSYAVGFRQLERYDSSRVHRLARDLEGRPRTGERARPIRVSIWYPAETSQRTPLTWGDYAAMVAGEENFGTLTPEQMARGRRALFRFPLLSDLSGEERARLEAMPSKAVRDAVPVRGKFPLILYSLGSAVIGHVTPEYLASHGYVVVQSPRLGAFAGLPPDNRDGLDILTKVADMDFLINTMSEFPSADLHNLGALGFSAGGRWALSKAMAHPDVRCVVSLDSVMLFKDATQEAWKGLPFFNPESVRIPILHMIRRAWVPREDPSLWDAMRYADRTALVFEDAKLDHLDFQSVGFALTLAGARTEAAPAIARAFSIWNRYTLAFLDAHLKGDAEAKRFLARPPAENGVPAGFLTVSRKAGEPAPLTLADILNSVDEDDVASVERVYRRGLKESERPPEDALNLAGYNLLFSGRIPEAIRLLTVNAEAFPASPNAWDSLADAYLAAGDRAKARDLSLKAKALLEISTGLDPQKKQRIQESIEGKLKRLKR